MVSIGGTQHQDSVQSLPVPWVLHHILVEGTLFIGHIF